MTGVKTKPWPSGRRYLVAAAALGAMCRSYEIDPPEFSERAGSSGSGGNAHGGSSGEAGGSNARGGEAGDGAGNASGAGDGGRAGSATGGDSGTETGGVSGSAGTNSGGASGDGMTGGTGGDPGPTEEPEPGILGAVRVHGLVEGMPKCGGSLLNNDWVLTADQCAPTDDPATLEVGFGMDAENFQQTRRVLEIQRFPGNDGSEDGRGRDLLLLGLAQPFEIDGKTSGYYRPTWAVTPQLALIPHRCVGWDLRVSDSSPTTRLHEESLTPYTFELNTTNGPRPSGSRVWWLNGNVGQGQDVLPMPADVGSACFHTLQGSTFLHTVHSQNPPKRRNGEDNLGREAYSVAIGELETRKWIDSVMFDVAPDERLYIEELELVGEPGVCASAPDRIELFGVLSNGQLGWSTWTNGTWTGQRLFDPPSASSFVLDSPGVYCPNGGSIELFVTGTDGAIWWRRMTPSEEWPGQWDPVPDVRSTVGSGVSVTGVLPDHWFVFVAATSGELRYAEFDGEWTGKWENLGGTVVGTPAALLSEEGRVDVYALGTDNRIWQRWMHSGTTWTPQAFFSGPAHSEPTVFGWNFSHVNVLTRSPSGTLQHEMYQAYWTELMVTGFSMPEGKPSAVSRHPGSADIFVRRPDGILWHGFWPRKPKAR